MGILVGLISDTHGLVRPEVFPALEGVELILHAGDVGEGVLEELNAIAPVHAVYGNTDPAGFPGLDDALELASVVGLDGDDLAAVALGEQPLLGDAPANGVGEGGLGALVQAVLGDAELATIRRGG